MAFRISQYLELNDAQQIMQEAEKLMFDNEFEIKSQLILNLVQQSKCSAYDCEHVAFAQQFAINLVTADQKILKEFPLIAISLDYSRLFLREFSHSVCLRKV